MKNIAQIHQNLNDVGVTELKSVTHEWYDDILKQRHKLTLKYFHKPELKSKKFEHLNSVDYYVEIYKDKQWTWEFVNTFPYTRSNTVSNKLTIKQLEKDLEIWQQYDFYLLTRGFYVDMLESYNRYDILNLDNDSIEFNLGTELNNELVEFWGKFSIIDSKFHICIEIYSFELGKVLHFWDKWFEIPTSTHNTPEHLTGTAGIIFNRVVKYLENNYEKIIQSYNCVLDNYDEYLKQPHNCEWRKSILDNFKKKSDN